MKRFTKRFFPIILMCLMVCSIFPTAAFAAEATCPFCDVTCSYTVDYEQWTDNIHCVRHWCSNCGLDMCGGVLGEDHTMSNGVCTLCGYDDGTGGDEEEETEPDVCYHYDTYTDWYGCNWYEYCSDCGEYMDSGTSHGSTYTEWSGCDWYEYCNDCDELMDSGTSHGSYSYSAWEYYNTSRHRRYYSCDDCGDGSYTYGYHSTTTEYTSYSSSQHTVGSYCATCNSYVGSESYESHDLTYGSWSKYSSNQHRRSVSCSDCGYSSYEYAGHSLTYGSWKSNDSSQHYRTVSCSTCGYSATEYASHSLTYGAWAEYSDTQHKRTVSCSACGYNTTEYGSHSDTDNDGECDSCGYGMSYFSVTVPAVMMMVVSENGEVTAATNAVIINNSSAAVVVSDVTILSADGWTIVPYDNNMANEKVNANLIGFRLENIRTTDYGNSASFAGNWTVDSGDELPLTYDAVVSAASRAITDEQVLTVIFVIEWAV